MLLLILTLFTFFQLSDSICFKTTCRSTITGQPGCKHVIKGSKDFTDDQCCQHREAAGFALASKPIGGACYECNSCTDIITKRDGGWSKWSSWSPCSRSCAGGNSKRQRFCNNPLPSKLGKPCDGNAEQTKKCNTQPCPIHGGWSSWSTWSPCSASCEQGTTTQERSCTEPAPQYGGDQCPGKSSRSKSCVLIPNCPIDGGWSKWSGWSSCTVTCGGGRKEKRRFCNNPPPQHNGAKCIGNSVQRLKCNVNPCPIHGEWSEWSDWGPCIFDDCEKSEDGGQQTRTRSCTNPAPDLGGRMCVGKMFDVEFCVEKDNCARDGEWSDWSPWLCTATGASRLRSCDNPAPAMGGKNCPGTNVEWIKTDDKKFCKKCPKYCNVTKKPVVEGLSEEGESGDGSGDGGSGDGSGDDDGEGSGDGNFEGSGRD